jgi:hypothetical protein
MSRGALSCTQTALAALSCTTSLTTAASPFLSLPVVSTAVLVASPLMVVEGEAWEPWQVADLGPVMAAFFKVVMLLVNRTPWGF